MVVGRNVMASWLGTLGVGVAVGAMGLVLGGWLASHAVHWYQVPSREGASGYFVVFQALFALVAGAIIGVVVSRMVVGAGGTQLKALLLAGAAHVALLAVVGTVARLMADVPPTFEGERLMLAVEVSWPEATAPRLPSGDVLPYIGLSSASGDTVRVGRQGPLWVSDARRENARLVVPGAVEVFTSRGKPLLFVNTGTKDQEVGLALPLPGYPGKAQRDWSEWMPNATSGAPALGDGIRYRFRVIKRNEPVRTQTVGAFTIGTVAQSFTQSRNEPLTGSYAAPGDFVVHYRGAPVTVEGRTLDHFIPDPWKPKEGPPPDAPVRYKRISGIATVPGPEPALVVRVEYTDTQFHASYYYLLQPDGQRLRTTFVSAAQGAHMANRLAPPVADAPTQPLRERQGEIDDSVLAVPGLYLFPRAVFDTRARTVQPLPLERSDDDILKIAPLSLSPDEKHFARLIRNSNGSNAMLIEQITIADNTRRTLPTGSAIPSTGKWHDADHAFFDHYFAWETKPGGGFQVVARAAATSLPYRGSLKESVGHREYRLARGAPSLREAVIAEMVKTLDAQRMPANPDTGTEQVRMQREVFNLSQDEEGEIVIWMENRSNTLPLVKVARHLDSVLATRRLDAHFKPADASQ